MSNPLEQSSKKDFLRLIESQASERSSCLEKAFEYLREEGIDTEKLIEQGISRIKQIRLRIEASKTKAEMKMYEPLRVRAIKKVKELLADSNFSFPTFIKQEGIILQNRNFESFTDEDIERTLINYFHMKYIEQENAND